MNQPVLGGLLLILLIGMPLVLLLQRLRVSALVAYLITGAVAGSLGVVHLHDLHLLAEIGATLLLFAIGLELDLPSLMRHRKAVIIGAIGQMGSTLLVGWLLVLGISQLGLAGFALDWRQALAVGACITVSSTLMVLRALDERHLRNRPEGTTVMGLLLSQDIALAPLMVLISVVLPGEDPAPLWRLLVGTIGCLVAVFWLRRVLGSQVVSRIRLAKMPELEVAFAVVVALGAAWLTDWLGLGAAVGAFSAGLALGGDEHRHSIETAVKPLEGLMAIFFFVSIGILFDPHYVLAHIPALLIALIVVLVLKATLAALALRVGGLSTRSAVGGGLMTAQLGEFSFILASAAFGAANDHREIYQLIVHVTIFSLGLTPFLIVIAGVLLPRSSLEQITKRGQTIVVAGLGPVGNTVVETLHHLGQPLLLVDRNPILLQPWHDTKGITCHQGRIEDMEDWMPAIGSRPAAVVLTFPIADTSALVTERLKGMDPNLVMIARCPFQSQIDTLRNAGVGYVICDEVETTKALSPILRDALGLAVTSDSHDRTATEQISQPV